MRKSFFVALAGIAAALFGSAGADAQGICTAVATKVVAASTYTIGPADFCQNLVFTAATPTVTIPTAGGVGVYSNFWVNIFQEGTGSLTLTGTVSGGTNPTVASGAATVLSSDGAAWYAANTSAVAVPVPAASITGTLGVGHGGTGVASGTSGGFLGFTAGTTLASTGAIAANHAVTGGGAGAVPIDSLVTLTKPATGATLTLADGKTLTVSKTMTITAPDDTAVSTLPAGSHSLAPLDSPSFTTPTLGVASATTINKVTLTAPAAGSTLTLADGKTLTANNTLTLAGTDSTTMTFPTTSASVARTDAGQTFTGNQTLSGAIINTGITTDSTHTDATVCEDTTSHQYYFGSGASGICLGTSSLRFKHDVRPLAAGLDAVLALDPIVYRYNKGVGADPDKDLYGFAAEQVNTVLPQLVGLDVNGRPNSVDWAGIVPVLVRAIQDQQHEIDELKRHARHASR